MSGRKITCIGIAFALVTCIGLAKAPTVPPPYPGRGGIGVIVGVKPPKQIGQFMIPKIPAEQVYFARLDDTGDGLEAESAIPSNYSRSKQVYLLNARPGRYVAVAAKWVIRDNKTLVEEEYTAFFSGEMIRKTEVTVVPGRIVFMGRYVVNTSTNTKGADAAQSHYLRLISPETAEQGALLDFVFGKFDYTATLEKLSNDPATEDEFWRVARKKAFAKQPAWKEFLETQSEAPRGMAARSDPLGELAGDWDLKGFVIGGDGLFSVHGCGKVSIAPPIDGAVSVAAACEGTGDYHFRLKSGSDMQTYLISVKSQVGFSIEDFPVTYVKGQGWHGALDQLVDVETLSITAVVAPTEGRTWYGWTIEVLPTAAVDSNPEEITQPYFKADLTRRK